MQHYRDAVPTLPMHLGQLGEPSLPDASLVNLPTGQLVNESTNVASRLCTSAPTSRLLRLAGAEISQGIRHPLPLVDAQFRKDGDA